MNIEDNGEFGRRLMALGEVFDVKISPQRAALYFEALRDLPFQAVAAALNAAVQGCKFFPKPVELRQFAQGDIEDVTEIAWLAAKKAMSKLGYMASVSVQDAALGETILAVFGSWVGACTIELSPEMWASKRKEFGRVYRVMRQRNLDGARYLPGEAERNNSGRRDWLRYVPMGCIESGGTVKQLTAEEGELERMRLAAVPHGLSRMDAGEMLKRLKGEQEGGSQHE